jgi:hypothetical protein
MDATVVANEFAAVVVEVVRQGHGQRLRLRDLDSGACVTLDALDLRTFCLTDEVEQRDWLRIAEYREGGE